MAREELTDEQIALLDEAEELGIDTLGYSVPEARFDRLRERVERVKEGNKLAAGTDVQRYADKAMFEAEGFEDAMPRVYLLSATHDPLGAIAAASMMYEGKVCRNINDITHDERVHYWEESFKGHLKAPWEFLDLHFMVEGVTRAFTHQMVRQRTAVYAQESMRFAVKEEIAARPGPIIDSDKKTRAMWDQSMKRIWQSYQWLIAQGVPAEEARGLLPHDTLTRLNYKTNLRNLAEHLGNRLCTQAQFEWRLVAAELRQAIQMYGFAYVNPTNGKYERNDWQFKMIADSPIFQPVCFTVGHCPFKAGYDRGCTIRERVDEGKFEEIRVEEWLADPKAGWVK